MSLDFNPNQRETSIRQDRSPELDVHRVLAMIPMLPYHVVADIGCGSGYFTVPIGKYLFDGRVHAFDFAHDMLEAVREQIENIHLTNVELALLRDDKLPLENDCLDGAFAAFLLGKVGDPKTLLEEGRRCLRPGGWLALIEWSKREMEVGPPSDERIDEAELRQIAREAGLCFTARYSLNDNQYMLLMGK